MKTFYFRDNIDPVLERRMLLLLLRRFKERREPRASGKKSCEESIDAIVQPTSCTSNADALTDNVDCTEDRKGLSTAVGFARQLGRQGRG